MLPPRSDNRRSVEAVSQIIQQAPFALTDGEPLHLSVFGGWSVVEVCANERQAIGRRLYPGRADNPGVALSVEGGSAAFVRVSAWEMMPANA